MNLSELRKLNDKYYVTELLGILMPLIMGIAVWIPMIRVHEEHQAASVLFFFVIFAMRLLLFLWNRKAEGTEGEEIKNV